MISPVNYAALYDFTAIEVAVQAYFVSTGLFAAPPGEDDPARKDWLPGTGAIACFTAREENIFQKHTPRVTILLNNLQPMAIPFKAVADGNGALRNHAWRGTLSIGLVTQPKYGIHLTTRNTVHALGEMIAPMVSDPTILLGANQFLSSGNHCIYKCENQNIDLSISEGEAAFGSVLNYQITFGVVAGKFEAIT